ncbi:MAG: glycosyltransferase family 39 protein [Polyangia bacterium]
MIRRAVPPIVLFLVCAGIYSVGGRSSGSGDTAPTRMLPFSLIEEGDFDLDEFPALYGERARSTYPTMAGLPYYLRERDGHYYSAYTPAPAVLAVPIYLVAVIAGFDAGSTEDVALLERLAAALICALSVALLYLAARQRASLGWSLVVALTYGLATSTYSTSSQALWQHGPSQLFLAAMLLFLARAERDDRYIPAASAALSCAVAMRSTNLLLGLPLGIWLLVRHRRRWMSATLAFLPPVGLLVAYYLVVFGSLGPSGEAIEMGPLSGFGQVPLHEGLYGVLFGPARGLFFYSPVLLFSLPGAVLAARRGDWSIPTLVGGAALVTLLVGKWFVWWGGHCFGSRLLADIAPLLSFALLPVGAVLKERRWLAALFGILLLYSVAVQALGAWRYDGRFDAYAKTDLCYANMLRSGGGPIAFYAIDLARELELTDRPLDDLGPPPARPWRDENGRRRPPVGGGRSGRRLAVALMEAPIADDPNRPEIEIETDDDSYRPDERIGLRIETRNPARPHTMNAFVLMRGPRGEPENYWRDGFERVAGRWPMPWTQNSPLPHDVEVKLGFRLDGRPPGVYEICFVLTDTFATRVEGRSCKEIDLQ